MIVVSLRKRTSWASILITAGLLALAGHVFLSDRATTLTNDADQAESLARRQLKDRAPGLNDAIEAQFVARRRQVQKACKKYYTLDPTEDQYDSQVPLIRNDSKPYFIVDQQHKILFCRVPYAGSVAWKKLFIQINLWESTNNKSYGEAITDEMVRDDNATWPNIVPLSSLSNDEIKQVLGTFKKIMIVRNPIDRMIIAWRDLLTGNNEFYSKKYGNYIVSKFRLGNPVVTSTRFTSTRLREFLNFIIRESNALADDPAWRQQHLHCLSCQIDWNFIAKAESIADESDYLMAHILGSYLKLNQQRWKLPQPSNKQPAIKYNNKESLKANPQPIINEILKLYAPDLEMFGYDYSL